jgi:23S rRNA pseudouridine2605 synthase
MAKRTRKKAEPNAIEAQQPSATVVTSDTHDNAEVAASEALIDQEAEHRMQDESPALPLSGEAEAEAPAADTFEDAIESTRRPEEVQVAARAGGVGGEGPPESAAEGEDDGEAEFTPAPRPPAKLERLQKILSQAGVASRRHAEELITQGRVQVNGKIVSELGSKADAGRDHIRVDGKLLQGPERLRYFVLNKPKGYVTTVSDPEGRDTVMEFFTKMSERLYPVGRLDYQSEGLLLVTNDGDLANKLTKAATGVEKTYLVKVSGQPTEAELDRLREGVTIERGKPGEGRVQTAPASVRQVRQGDNPWYEVVLIEGRNRELRKMFEEIGHFVEKIRRVGYGPLVLDQEPGQFRELRPDELAALRQAAEGKWRRPKARAAGRRDAGDRGELPTVVPKPSRPRPVKPFEGPPASAGGARPFPPKKSFGKPGDREQARPFRPTRPPEERSGPATGRAPAAGERFAAGKAAAGKFGPRTAPTRGPAKFGEGRPAWKKDDKGARPPARFKPDAGGEDRRGAYRDAGSASRPAPPGRGSTGQGRTGGSRTFGARPAWNKTGGREPQKFERGGSASRTSNRPRFDAPRSAPPRADQSGPADSRAGKPRFERTGARPGGFGSTGPRPSGPPRPPRAEGLARPFTTSTGKPRAGGARPSSKPAGRSYGGSSSGPRNTSGARSAGKPGWKPKPSHGGTSRPTSSGASKRPPSKSASRGPGRGPGPRSGGSRPGGGGGKRY